jgi:peptide/nickel transport system substrate-binding protein
MKSGGLMFRGIISRLFLVVVLAASCTSNEEVRSSLTILLPDDILSTEPNREFETITDSVLCNVYDPLVGFDKDMHLTPALAESWGNPKPDEWRFQLRKNVHFHDGTPVTAPLLREILLQIQSNKHLEAATFLEQIDDIIPVNNYTLAIKTKAPFAFLTKLPFIYFSKQSAKPEQFPGLVGTGAFYLKHRKIGVEIRLKASEKYWGTKPHFDEVVYHPVHDSMERYKKLLRGEADIAYQVPPQITQQEQSTMRILSRPGLAVTYLGLNVRQSETNPLDDLRVRRALHLALDRKQIVEKVLRGNGVVSTQPIAPSVFGFNPDIGYTAPDLQHAQNLLKEAGYENGFKIRLDFNNSRISTAKMIQEHLKSIRVDVELNGMMNQGLFDTVKSGMSQMYLIGWDCSSGDASEFYEFCLHTQIDGFGLGNYGGYSNIEIDNIAKRNMRIVNHNERKQVLQRAAKMTMEDLPVLPLYVEDDIYATKKNIHFDPRADHEIKLIDIKLTEQ